MEHNSPAAGLFGEARVGLGCMALTGLFGHVDRATAVRTIHRALELGVHHFDTAELYGPYANEELLAEALASRPDQSVVATKVGYKIIEGKIAGMDCRPEALRLAVEGSLRRLRRDRIDLVYQHRQDPVVPVEDAVGALDRLRAEGKIVRIGLSAVDSTTLARAAAVCPISAVQNQYSLLHREGAEDILSITATSSVAFVAFSPLARGLLSGTARSWLRLDGDDYRLSDERFAPERLAAMTNSATALQDIAASRRVPVAAVALSWLLSRSPNLAVIPGCKSPAQVDLAIEALQIALTAGERKLLEAIRPCLLADQRMPDPAELRT